jgi:hypothetical protein
MMIAHWMDRDYAYQLGNEGDFSTTVARAVEGMMFIVFSCTKQS